MANKTDDNNSTVLIKTKEEFEIDLSDRIRLGEEIISKPLNDRVNLKRAESEYFAWNDFNSEYLKHAFNKESNEYRKDYNNVGVSYIYVLGGPASLAKDIAEFKERIGNKIKHLINLKNKTILLKVHSEVQVKNSKNNNGLNKNQVFIVHGHDEEAKSKSARFIEKLGLEAIILHEKASSSKTIIEKIEEYSNVGFGIILYTPCDLGSENVENPSCKARARQNVVFEHGFLTGRIGRENICALVKGEVEIPNDISGVVYVKMNESDSWMFALAKEMKQSGYEIDMNRI